MGPERVEQTLRTRLAFKQVPERLDGSDGLGEPGFDVATLQGVLYASRNMAAELILEDLVSLCTGVDDWAVYSSAPAQVELACDILADWDGRSNVDSVGVPVFTELWRLLRDHEELWAVPFSPDDPVHTPNTLNIDDAAVAEDVKQALADAVALVDAAGIALNAPWGEVQYAPKGGRNIPIHGADNMFSFSTITTELIPEESRYNIFHGNSYIQTVGWDGGECPDAWGMLVYSQSTDPESDHYADLTQLYSDKGWIDMPFCIEDVEAEQIGDAVEISE
jgi:acyl-homoserine-lactone acylase